MIFIHNRVVVTTVNFRGCYTLKGFLMNWTNLYLYEEDNRLAEYEPTNRYYLELKTGQIVEDYMYYHHEITCTFTLLVLSFFCNRDSKPELAYTKNSDKVISEQVADPLEWYYVYRDNGWLSDLKEMWDEDNEDCDNAWSYEEIEYYANGLEEHVLSLRETKKAA